MNLFLGLMIQIDAVLRHTRIGSYRTRTRYRASVRRFAKFLAVVFHLEKISNISAKHLCSYLELRQDDGVAAATIKCDLSAIRFFHDLLSKPKYRLPSNDDLAIDLERRRFKDVDRAWSEKEYLDFLALARKDGQHDYADEIVMAYKLGLRLHETFRIDTAIARDALKRDVLTIRGKGGKVREIPLVPAAREVLERRLSVTARGEKLFVPPDMMTHIAMWDLEKFIRDHRNLVRDPNNPVALTYHGLRHSYAKNTYKRMIEQGRTPLEAHLCVSRLLGHERADVTDIYLVGSMEGYDDLT